MFAFQIRTASPSRLPGLSLLATEQHFWTMLTKRAWPSWTNFSTVLEMCQVRTGKRHCRLLLALPSSSLTHVGSQSIWNRRFTAFVTGSMRVLLKVLLVFSVSNIFLC